MLKKKISKKKKKKFISNSSTRRRRLSTKKKKIKQKKDEIDTIEINIYEQEQLYIKKYKEQYAINIHGHYII